MPNKIIVSVGSDVTNPKKFYWDIKTVAAERDLIYGRKGFDSLEEAKADIEEFRGKSSNPKSIVWRPLPLVEQQFGTITFGIGIHFITTRILTLVY